MPIAQRNDFVIYITQTVLLELPLHYSSVFYSASTLIGVLADSPEKRSRFMRYPDTLRLMSCKAVRDALDDPKANEVAEKGEPLLNLLFVPKVVLIFRDQESRAAMEAFDWDRALEFVSMRPPVRR